jgi:hypothetical protein
MQQDHMIFFSKEFKFYVPDGSIRLRKRLVMPCHSYSDQQQHMINKRPGKRKEKFVDHILTYDCGIIFSVLIKY